MVKNLFFVLILAIAGIASMNAQVRISGSEAPNKSAVLDLNPDDRTSEGNATGGLAMPRVRLKNTANPYPLLTHVKGMTVYNTATEGDVTPGVYTANGSKWVRQADSESLENLATNIYSTVFGDTIINYITGNMDNTALMDSVINRITNNNSYLEQLINSISTNIYNTELGDSIINYITQYVSTTALGDSIAYYISQHFETTELGDTIMQYITQNLDRSALMDSVANYITNNNEYLEGLINSVSSNIYNTVLGDSIINYITQHVGTTELGDSIAYYISQHIATTGLGDSMLEYITQNVYHTALGDSIVNLIHENESDGVIGNEVTGATPTGGLIRAGAGTTVSPYTLGIASGGVTNTHLSNSAVTVEKISDNAVTTAKIADGAITNANINTSAAIALSKIALPEASANNGKVLKSNGTTWIAGDDNNTDANTTYTAGNGLTLAGTTFSIGTGQVNNAMLADGSVANAKLADNAVTSAKIADGVITDADISATADIAGTKLADKSVAITKVNATGTASATTYLRGDGSWATPAGDGQGVTSVSGANGLSVSNGTTTPEISLPAGATVGNVLKWNGTVWASAADAGITSEQDGIIGNEVINATSGGGLTRSGSGTVASPYTLGIASGGVTNTYLANGSVTAEKISDSAVTTAKIADGAITNANINISAAIALSKIALPEASANNGKVLKSNGTTWIAGDDNNTDANTTYTAGNGLTLAGTTFSIGTGQVNNAMLADGSVASAKLADNAVTSAKIADGTITNADISATAGIAGSKLADKSVAITKVNATGTASATTYLRGDGSWAALAEDGPKFLGMLSATVPVSTGSTETNYMLTSSQCSAIGMTDTDYSKRYFGIVTNIGPVSAVTSFNIVSGYDYYYPYVKLLWGNAVTYSFQTQIYVLVYEY